MSKKPSIKMQLGKSGLMPNFIESLRKTFKNRDSVRISLLKSYSREREKLKNTAEELCKQFGDIGTFKYTIIGFTIILKKKKLKNGERRVSIRSKY